MKQKNGIICLETEWEHTVERNRRSIHTKPLLEFLEKSDCITLNVPSISLSNVPGISE